MPFGFRSFLAATLTSLALTAGAQTAPPQTRMLPDIAYCSPQGLPQRLDLHLPDASRYPGTRPVAVYIHGGGWTGGSRRDPRARPEIDELLARGWAVAAVGYRFAPAFPMPAALDDVRCAVRFLRANAATWSLDPQRVVAWGTSAGGHLAALLAYAGPASGLGSPASEWTGVSHQVRAVGLLYAPLDLTALFAGAPASAWSPIFGSQSTALTQYSPVQYAGSASPPTLLIHGQRDTLVPASQSVALLQRLQGQNVPVALQLVTNAGHSYDLVGGPAMYPGRGDLARQLARFFEVEALSPSDAVRADLMSDAACVAEWLPTVQGADFHGAHNGLAQRPGATGTTTVRNWSGSQTWWATDGQQTWVGGGRFGPAAQPGAALSQMAAQARAGSCGLTARR